MLQSLQYFNLDFLFNFFLIFFFWFYKKALPVVWLQGIVGRLLPSWGGSWPAPCQRLTGCSLLTTIRSSGYIFFSIYSRFPWFPRQLHHSLYFCTCPKNVVADLCVCSVQPGPVAQAAALLRPEGSSEPRGEIRLWPASQRIQLHHRGRRVRLAQECVCGVLSQ